MQDHDMARWHSKDDLDLTAEDLGAALDAGDAVEIISPLLTQTYSFAFIHGAAGWTRVNGSLPSGIVGAAKGSTEFLEPDGGSARELVPTR